MEPPLKTPLQTLAYKQTKGLMPVPRFLDWYDSTKKHMGTFLGQAKAPKHLQSGARSRTGRRPEHTEELREHC